MRSILLLAIAAIVATEATAFGIVFSEDELEGTSTEAGVIVRAFGFTLGGSVLEPPFLPEDQSPSELGILDLRLYAAHRTSRLKLVVHNQVTTTVRSHEEVFGLGIGRGLSPPRWLPLSYYPVTESRVALETTVDWVYAAYSFDRVTVTVGRQPITFGRGKIWRPTDLVGTFALTEVDTEYKPGADAVRIDVSIADRTSATLIAATGEIESDADGEQDTDFAAELSGTTILGRFKRGFDAGELAGTAGFVRNDLVAGGDGTFDLGQVEAYAEATLTYVRADSIDSPEAAEGDLVPKAVLGATYKPISKLTVGPELLYNGFGATDESDYLAVATSGRVAIGEQITFGRAYAGTTVLYEIHPLITFSGVGLVNVLDPSALVSVGVRYSVSGNVEAFLGGYAGLGERPDAMALAPRSEYGLFPLFAFAELKAVL